ncbi:MAG: PilZ domain-containing protein [Acidobacteria bacterium]|nr:PilZ domain-containing protein [Acidobacteriota bacterium]
MERRASQRFPLRLQAAWRQQLAAAAAVESGETVNLSSSGVLLLARERSLAAGQCVEIFVWLPVADGETACLSGSGRVVRVEAQSRDRQGVAVALQRLDWCRPEDDPSAT